MRRIALKQRLVGLPALAAALALVVIVLGGLVLLRPSLRGGQELVAGVPEPPAFSVVTEFSVPPGEQACMSLVAIDPASRLAEIGLSPASPTKAGGPPVDLVLSAPGYRGVVKVPGGYPGGIAILPIVPPPRRTEIGSACFINVGKTTVALHGTTEARTVTRSTTTLDGRQVPGDIALTFIDNRRHSLLEEIDTTFGRASNLTDGLVPVWLIWVLALLVLLAVGLGPVAALYLALAEDERAPAADAAVPRSGGRRASTS